MGILQNKTIHYLNFTKIKGFVNRSRQIFRNTLLYCLGYCI